MKFEVHAGTARRTVEAAHDRDGALRFRLDSRTIEVDVLQVAGETYSLLINGHSFEARVHPEGGSLLVHCGGKTFAIEVVDPRAWRGTKGGLLSIEGRQQISAPMPGKVVRVLVTVGEHVDAGQGLAVVEAMKMQNEVRSPKSGVVERLTVKENQAVSAGQVMAVIA